MMRSLDLSIAKRILKRVFRPANKDIVPGAPASEQASAIEEIPDKPDFLMAAAMEARDRACWPLALKCWDQLKTRFPNLPISYSGAAQALFELGRADDAEVLLAPAIRIFPNDGGVLKAHAYAASARRDWSAATTRWRTVLEQFPDDNESLAGLAAALRGASRFEEAEAVLATEAEGASADLALMSEYARIAAARHCLAEAVCRWQRAMARFPDVPAVRISLASAFDEMGQGDKADATLLEALDHFPANPDLLAAAGWVANRRKDWAEAERRWTRFRERAPACAAQATVGYADMLRMAGRQDEAFDLLTAALRAHPDHFELQFQTALVTTIRRDWTDALPRWEKLKKLQPGNEGVQTAIAAALWQARLDLALAVAGGGKPPFEIPPALLSGSVEDLEGLTALFTRFESLGDGCEFGMVQRRFKAEPLGLLRWTSIGAAELVRLLETRFEGVGAPDNVTLDVWDGEYVTLDKRFRMAGHTFTRENAEPRDRFLQQQCRRLAYLSRKLIEDLEAGEKIFVHLFQHDVADDYMIPMYKCIRRFSENSVLFGVRLDESPSPACRVERADDALFIGYMDRFSTVDINYDGWINICRNVAEQAIGRRQFIAD